MLFERKAIVCAGLLFGIVIQTSSAADPVPLSVDVVKGLSLAELSKRLESTGLHRLPLRLVLDERITSLLPGDKTEPQIRHHVIIIDPGSKCLRYDRVDYGSSGNAPYVCSSFTDGIRSGRWECGLNAEDVPRLLKGDPGFVQRRGMCYVGPHVCYSPDIVLRVMGLTLWGKPLVNAVRELGDSALITPDAAGDGFVVETKLKKLMLNAHGVLKQYLIFGDGYGGADKNDLTIIESIMVTETGRLGTIPLPTKIYRRFNYRGMSEESVFEVRLQDCRVVSAQEVEEVTNPLLSKGTIVVGDKNGLTLDREMRVFGAAESSRGLLKGDQ